MTKRYVIIGAGAIGGAIGGLLANAGVPTVLVARGPHLEQMRTHGLTLRAPDFTSTADVEVAGGPADVELTADDVLVLTTKTHQAEAALATWADAPVLDGAEVIGTAGARLPVLTALNGVASESLALRWFARVFGVCVWMPAVHLQPGEVILRAAPRRGMLHAGRFPAALATPGDAQLLAEIAADWDRAGLSVPTPPDVMAWKYRKLLGNLGNAFQALLGDRTAAVDLLQRAREEATELFALAGIELSDPAEDAELRGSFTVHPVPGQPAELGGSTWQSLARGAGSAESDYLNGEIVALAHQLGRRAPINATIASMMRAAVTTGARPGDLTEQDLAAAVAAVIDRQE